MWRYNLGTKRANDPIGGSKRTCGLPPPISLPCLGLKNLAAKPRLYWFSVGGSPGPPPSPELRHRFSQVADFTAELFPGELRVEVMNDPEILDDLFFRFRVDATGTIDDIAARNDEWHARVCRLPVRFSGMFRLSIAVFKRRSV
jgi:hypothetical protein